MDNEFIIPTGKIIKEYLNEYDINQKELCSRIDMSEKHISNLLNGKSRITEDFTLRLEKVLVGIPASYWLNHETKYRERLAREAEVFKLGLINLQDVAKRFRFKEIFKGLGMTITEQAIEMLKLLKISDFSNFDKAYSNLNVDYFMEDGGEKESIAIWINLCESEIEIQNEDLGEIVYERRMLEDSLEKFKMIALNEDVELSLKSCRKLCNKLGIYLVICGAITNSKVRGAITTYKGHPAIYLSGRFKSHDHIWFAFMHEIAHLLMHYNKNDIIISYEDSEIIEDRREIEANVYARDFFINPKTFADFISKGEYTKESIRKFAINENVLPGIVVARLQHDGKIGYEEFSYLK